MTNKLIALLLLTSHLSFAQYRPLPTQFDKFVNNRKISWAAYASDTIQFTRADLNNLLLFRLGKKEIKASLPVESRTKGANQITYTTSESIDNTFYGENEDLIMDAEGNTVKQKKVIPKKDSSNFRLTEVTQILYIEKGQLKSYIPFITPTLPVFLSTGNYIGERFYFTSGFNYRYNRKPHKKSKLIFLTQTKKMINLNPEVKTDQLKEMYGHNLLESFWPYILENKLKIFSVYTKGILKSEELNMNLTYEEPKISPIYNSNGVVVKYSVNEDPIDPKRFTDIQLIQDWYYDPGGNKVYSYIKEMVLYLVKFNKIKEKEAVPVLKIVFN
jgi:hypothetical protein